MRVYKATALCYTTQLDDGVVGLTSYTEDSGNAALPVCHCDHNKIKAAAVTKYSLYLSFKIRYKESFSRDEIMITVAKLTPYLRVSFLSSYPRL